MSNDIGDIETQLRDRVQRLLAQLAHDAEQLEVAVKNPGEMDAVEMRLGHNAALAVAKALQDVGDFGDNRQQ